MHKRTIPAVLLTLLLLTFYSACSKVAAPPPDAPETASASQDAESVQPTVDETDPSPSAAASPSPEPSPSPSPEPTQNAGDEIPGGLPTSIVNEDGTSTSLYISADSRDYMFWFGDGQNAESPIEIDFDGDGEAETLALETIHDLEYKPDEELSYPIQITLKLGGSKAVFTSKWNNGISLRVADFNKDDAYTDILIYEAGPDLDGRCYIYRCDGRIISEYMSFDTQHPVFSYDGQGNIYYVYKTEYYDKQTQSISRDPIINELDYDSLAFNIYPRSSLVRYVSDADGAITKLLVSGRDTDFLRGPDTYDYLTENSVVMDFDGDGTDDTLRLEISQDFEDNGSFNCPVRVNMTIAGSSETFESTWNDGVYLYAADFDTGDQYLDLYFYESNTDVSGQVYIYRYDGRDLQLYASFHIEGSQFTYDAEGTLYFNTFVSSIFTDSDDMSFVTAVYDYDNNTFEIYDPQP